MLASTRARLQISRQFQNPIEQTGAAIRVVTTKGHVRTIKVPEPVVRTVINGHTSVVRLPGTVHRQVVAASRSTSIAVA